MDWFNQDDNMFLDNDKDSFSYENIIDIENVFLKKQNSYADYEVKMDDFVLNKYDEVKVAKFPLEPIEGTGDIANNMHYNLKESNKIFLINKEKKKSPKTSLKSVGKNKILSKEELARHPFLNSSPHMNLSVLQETQAGTISPSSKQESVRKETNQSSTKDNYYHSTASIEENSESVINSLKNDTYDSNEKIRNNKTKNSNSNSNEEDEIIYSIDECEGDVGVNLNKKSLSIDSSNSNNTNLEKIECDSLRNNNNSVINNTGMKNLILNLNSNFSSNKNNFNASNGSSHFMNNKFTNGQKYCTGDSSCPYSYYIPLQNMPLSERMKIKKEKTKRYLEKKTKRDFNTPSDPANIKNINNSPLFTNKEKENATYCDNNNLNTQIINSSNSENSSTNSQTNTNNLNTCNTFYKDGIVPLHYLKTYENMELNANTENQSRGDGLSKKEVKMFRNRISAQRSRDRKKKEMDDLKYISQNLLNETSLLKRELENRDREIRDMKEKFNQLCKNCQGAINNNQNGSLHNINNTNSSNDVNTDANTSNDNNRNYSIVDSSRRFSTSLKYSMMAGFLVIVCLIANLSYKNISENKNENFQGRILNSIPSLSNNEETVVKSSNSNSINKIANPSSTGLILYNSFENQINSNSEINKNKKPFFITKDLNKFIKKKINLDTNFDSDEVDDQESSFLGKKRVEFFNKMQNRKKKNNNKNGFLQNSIINTDDMCVNVDGVAWSIQEELDLEKNENIIKEDNSRGIILKENNNYQNYNGVIPFKDERNMYEQSDLRDNIKSMYCKDFITTVEENAQMFKNLFEKLNMKVEENYEQKKEDLNTQKNKNEKKENDDCLYLHMIVPAVEQEQIVNIKKIDETNNMQNNYDSDSNINNNNVNNGDNKENNNTYFNKKVYYEVGCKIFEINKIYK